eukprot:CAMPEP_0185024244 /NCGR_PEP_ID=MMETSP1103-20130426/7239_1 /TAXON_ID=36769 /ORGANISM="Paraphysomonas bandaiensis, Strain Caron Lab Isolate" /LENGTH=255 /DNA_ID=CAMNT_0027557163 /DNA_START=94 /DNA_END=861 /DNA_ORIENTATION=+
MAGYDWTTGNLCLWHSEAAYCDPSSYLTRTWKGELSGFTPVYSINDTKHDTQGYVGYTSSQEAIYVSFRGSSSIQNWADNLDVRLTTYPSCSKCEVHEGFYQAEQSCFPGVLDQVRQLKEKFPSYTVIVTGHSLGAALATLTATDLVNSGISPVRMFNFGSPRVGNDELSVYLSDTVPDHSRVTHHKDMVVHIPMHERFRHISHEWYQPEDDIELNECSGYEDSTCSYQWHKTNVDDHLLYLGVVMGGDGCGAIL